MARSSLIAKITIRIIFRNNHAVFVCKFLCAHYGSVENACFAMPCYSNDILRPDHAGSLGLNNILGIYYAFKKHILLIAQKLFDDGF